MKTAITIALEFGKMSIKERSKSNYVSELTDAELELALGEFCKNRYTTYWADLFKAELKKRNREKNLGELGI